MTVEINPNYLLKNGITANQFLLLQLIYEDDYNLLFRIRDKSPEETRKDLDTLISIGFIEATAEGYKLTEKYLRTLSGKGFFEELVIAFPASVIRPDGIRDYLRTDKKRAERKYKQITKNRKDRHEYIIRCLKFELREREKNNSMMYMKKLPNWLRSESWKEWEEKMKYNPIEEEENSYGTNIF